MVLGLLKSYPIDYRKPAQDQHMEDKIKNFTYYSCSIINISINTHEIH